MTARCRVSHCHSILGPPTLFHKPALTPGVATTPKEADSSTAVRALILSNDPLDFKIETIVEEQTLSVSPEVVNRAMVEGVSLEIGGIVRVTFTADTDEVNEIMDDE